MRRAKLVIILVLLIYIGGMYVDSQCTLPVPPMTILSNVQSIETQSGETNTTGIVVDATYMNCITHASNPTLYLYAGLTVDYTLPGNLKYIRFTFVCNTNDNSWLLFSTTITPMAIVGGEAFRSASFRRDNCSSCTSDTDCVNCNASCLTAANNALGYCNGIAETDCCNFLLSSGNCTVQCPAMFTPNITNSQCVCQNFYTGVNCDVCSLNCVNGGTQAVDCSQCNCPVGFSGTVCDTNIDNCSPDPCLNGGSCLDGINTYTCNCINFWIGTNCSTCNLTCANGSPSSDCSVCNCDAGYTGTTCDVNIDDCSPDPCMNGGSCVDGVNTYTCNCINFWIGTNCSTCNLTCANGSPSSDCSVCNCDSGYTGTTCDVNIDDCSPDACMNGGSCVDGVNSYTCNCINFWIGTNCSTCNLTCTNGSPSFDCSGCNCDAGYTGMTCNVNIDDCSSYPCMNNGTCIDGVNGYTCSCVNNWSGDNCTTCSLDCLNGTASPNCSSCICNTGYEGMNCSSRQNVCDTNPCLNNATCLQTDSQPYYTCMCPASYTATNCETIINPCDPDPCSNNARCEVQANESYECRCVTTNVTSSCNNNGVCMEVFYTEPIIEAPPTYCECTAGYRGPLCIDFISSCDADACMNSGTCEDRRNEDYDLEYTCICEKPWYGPNCQLCAVDTLCENGGVRNPDCTGCLCRTPFSGSYCNESSCGQNELIENNACVSACTLPLAPSQRNDRICTACGIDFCMECIQLTTECIRCNTGYKIMNGACFRDTTCGIPNCARCFADICTVCEPGYLIVAINQCNRTEIDEEGSGSDEDSDINLALILGIIAGLLGLLAILIIISLIVIVSVLYYRKSSLSYKFHNFPNDKTDNKSFAMYSLSESTKQEKDAITV